METINPEARKRVEVLSYLDPLSLSGVGTELSLPPGSLLNGTQCSVVIKVGGVPFTIDMTAKVGPVASLSPQLRNAEQVRSNRLPRKSDRLHGAGRMVIEGMVLPLFGV